MDILLGNLQILQVVFEFVFSRSEYLHVASRIVRYTAQTVAQSYLLLALLAQWKTVDIDDRMIIPLSQFPLYASGNHSFRLEILPEKNIENQSYDGKKCQYEHPCQTFYRIAILCDDYHDRTQYGNGIYRIDHDVYPVVDGR